MLHAYLCVRVCITYYVFSKNSKNTVKITMLYAKNNNRHSLGVLQKQRRGVPDPICRLGVGKGFQGVLEMSLGK